MRTVLLLSLLAVTNAAQIRRNIQADASPAIAVSGCGICQAGGNTYRALRDSGCRSFTEESATIAPRLLRCPAGLIFDTTICVCNYEQAVTCASQCSTVPLPPIEPPVRPPVSVAVVPPVVPLPGVDVPVTIGCGQCQAGGNMYRTVTGSGCMAFTEEAPGIAPRRYVCPDGLVFDTNLCVCNWKEAVQCTSTCGARPATVATTTTAPAPIVTAGRPAVVELFVPSSGCQACKAGGNTYRALPGCRSFTEESDIIAPRKLNCPAGLIFDTTLCVCNYENSVTCASDCSSAVPAPTLPVDVVRPPCSITEVPPIIPKADDPLDKVTVGCGQCQAGGNTYRTVAGSGCMAFTEEAPGIAPRRNVCPEGLVFDTNRCVCNWKEAVQCSSTCGVPEPAVTAATTSKPPVVVVTLPTGRPPVVVATQPPVPVVDKFIPASGCGACQAGGNTYRTLPGCRSFTEESAVVAPRKIDCPAGLIFDSTLCVCNYESAVTCASDCGTVPQPPTIPPDVVRPPIVIVERPPVVPADDGSSKVTIGCGQCQAGGNTYRTVASSGCMAFTEEAPGIAPRRYSCPEGLVFDTNLCVCNWKEAVQCSSTCGVPEPAVTAAPTTSKPPVVVVTLPTGRPPVVDKFVPASGCRACQAGGNTYRALPGCRSFTEESDVVPPRKIDCPAGLIFDTTLCVCNYEYAVTCASDCGSAPLPPTVPPPAIVRPPTDITNRPPVVPIDDGSSKVTIGCGQCQAGGNTYRTLLGSGCMAFTEEAPGIDARRYVCPDGLVFDTNLCVCNWKEAVQCSSTCGVQPPAGVTTARPQSPAVTQSPTGRPPVNQFVPSSGCRACQAGGNTYRALPGCRSFTEESDVVAPRKLDCPAGLVFDTTLCVCNYENAVTCASDCGSVPLPPTIPPNVVRPPTGITDCPPIVPKDDSNTKVSIGCGQCQAGGNTYRTVTGSGCMAFTEEAPGIAPRRYVCPEGLVFDTNLCVCNWKEAVQCSATCGVQEPAVTAATTSKPPVVITLPTGRPPAVDKFIPASGCGVCQAGGNTYRALPGCRSFTEESAVVAPRKIDCPAGLVFDTTLCVCNYENAVTCASDCGSIPQPPTIPPVVVRPPTIVVDRPPVIPSDAGKVTIGCGQCQANGNTYRTLAGSACMVFSEEAPGIGARRLVCPDGLVFDTNLCVCNWKEAVQCSSTCGAQPPVISSTPIVPTQAVTQPTGRPPVDLFIPNSGCGACQAGGNTYRALPGCRAFTEESAVVAPRKIDCPAGLIFDTTLCVCNYEYAVTCASDCGSVPQPPTIPPVITRPPTVVVDRPPVIPIDDGSSKVTVGCGQCQAGGNTYRTLVGSDCMAFSEEAPGIAPRRYVCPDGLVFDTNLCVCNWKEAVQCSSTCGGQPPVINTTPRQPPQVVTVPTGRPPVDLFIPASGCQACQAGGNTYRALPGCRSFTEESDVIAPRKIDCPPGLIFDTTLCVCNYDYAVQCSASCGPGKETPTHPPAVPTIRPPVVPATACPPVVPSDDGTSKVAVGCGECKAGGNTYRTIAGSDCMAFTEEAPGIAARRYVCPDGLVFDTNLCVCNWREAVQCSSTCSGKPPAPKTEVVTPKPPAPVVLVDNVCGECRKGCTVFRVLEDGGNCNAFSEETTGALAPVRRQCPFGLAFDADLCMCNFKDATKCTCAARQPLKVAITPAPKVEIPAGCGTCGASGITFRTVPGTKCTAFTKETAHLKAERFNCNTGLVFDPSICQCNYPDAVSCGC